MIVLQQLTVFLSASVNLRIPLSVEDWRSVMLACLEVLAQGFNPQLVVSVIWSGSVYGYLEDPSTAECLAVSRGSADELLRLPAELICGLSIAVRQVSQAARLCALGMWVMHLVC
jgi:hypothetical protein